MAALGLFRHRLQGEHTDIFFNNIKVVKGGLANHKDREATEP